MAEARTVTLPNGKRYYDVPDSYSDADVYEVWKSQNTPAPVVAEEETPVVEAQPTETVTRNLTEAGLSADYLDSTVRKNAEARESGVPRYDFGPDFDPTRPDIKDVALDFGRIFADTSVDLKKLGVFATTKIARAVPNRQIQEFLDIIESPEMQSAINRTISEKTAEPIAKAMDVDVMTIFDSETGRIYPVDTAIGAVAEVGTYLAGGMNIYKNLPDLLMKSKKWANSFIKGTTSGATIDQLLTNPDENISNVVENALGEEAAREWNSYLFLSADQSDSEATKRLKLLGEGALLGSLIEVVGGIVPFTKLVRRQFNKTPKQLSKEDKGDLFLDFLEQQKKEITTPREGGSADQWKEDYVEPKGELEDASAIRNLREEPAIRFDETPEGEAQIRLQQSSMLNRFFNSTFTSRGFWTPRAFDAFNDAMYTQRATMHEAEIISSKLNTVINNFSENNPQLNDRVMTAFNTPLDDSASPYLTPIENVARQFDLPDEVAEQVLEGRAFIDQLSDRLSDSAMVNPELKGIIQDNIGSYIRRSFRLFEDTNYKPSEEIKNDAIDFIAQKYMNAGELPDLARQNAALSVNSILDRGDKSALEYMSSVQKLNNNIFSAKKDVPLEIRKLMGEIESADESVLVTAQKMSKFYSDANFHENLLRLGEGKYIFKVRNLDQSNTLPGTEAVSPVEPRATISTETDDVIFDTDVYNTEIKQTGSMLDGTKDEFTYYTTPEIASALKSDQGSFNVNNMPALYKVFLSLKGFSQKSKTVYSIPTQVRNVIGGAQFGPANGVVVNPASESVRNTFKSLFNNATSRGDEGLNELYNNYIRLGVVNTNTNIAEFRSLLESGFRDADVSLLEATNDTLKNYGLTRSLGETLDPVVTGVGKVIDPLATVMEKSYIAVDDFYKIVIYNSELDTLKKALPTADVSVLEAEAGRIVRSTVPNYDFVPPYIKRLRQMPFGSFVSFPAESLRTSVNIYREAFKEMGSNNSVLRQRGMRRFAGRTATAGVWYGAAEGMGALYGFTSEKMQALQTIDEKPWSKTSPRIPIVMDDEIYLIDTQFLNSYETINAPFGAMFEEVRNGKLKGDALDKRIIDGTLASIGDMLGPYTDQPVLTQAITDVGFAIMASDGRTPRGKSIFNDASTPIERLDNAIWHVFQSFLPTTVFSAEDIVRSESFLATPDRNTGYVTPTGLELAATFAGLRMNKLDPETVLGYRVSEYNGQKNDLARPLINYENRPEEIVDQYVNFEKARYRNMQDLYRQVVATKEIVGLSKTVMVLKNRGMGNLEIGSLLAGKYFTPYNLLTETTLMNIFEKTPFDLESDINNASKLIKALTDKRIEMLNTNLFFEEEESPPATSPEIGAAQQTEEQEFIDLKLAKGGEVYDVPQVPTEPDERIDKMTGLPYDVQAGAAFTDEEDRKMFAGGGIVKIIANLAATIMKNSKKPITESAATEAAENILKQVNMQQADGFGDDVPALISTDDPDYAEFLETETRVLLREKHDLPPEELEKQFGLLSDPENFSRRRGYTEEEVQDFNRSGELQDQIEIETGVDLMDETNLIQNALDDIQARDIEYNNPIRFPFADEPTPLPTEPKTEFNTGGKVLGSLQRTRKAEGGIFGLLEKGIKKGAAYLGFDDDRQLQISADATDLTKQIAPDKEVTWVHQGSPITTEQLRNLKTNRDQISLSGDEETFDAVNHALFGYESGAGPMTAFAGQAKEVYQGAKQAMRGKEWRTELKDMWNNSWGIDQRKQNLSRPEFDMNLAQAIMDTKGRMERGEALQMGRDIIINPRDLAQ
jgi:hypothetical protein